MKRIIIIIASVLCLLTSCQKEAPIQGGPITKGDIAFRIATDETKVSDTTPIVGEKTIHNIRLYVFDTDANKLDVILGSTYSSSNPTLKASIRHGHKRIIAVANQSSYPTEAQIKTPSDLLDTYIVKLDYSIAGNTLRMPLLCDMTIHFTPYQEKFTIPMKMAMARLCVKKITNKLAPPHNTKSIRLTNAYLTNLAGTRAIDASKPHTPQLWYNKFGRTSAASPVIIEAESQSDVKGLGYVALSQTVAPSATYSLPTLKGMYSFPNGTLTDKTGFGNGVFTPRFTRLVVTAIIDELPYYYPINLKNLQPGLSYDVNLTITKLGSDDPDTFNFMESAGGDLGIDGNGNGGDVDIEF